MNKGFSLLLSAAGILVVTSAMAMGNKPNAAEEEAINARIQPVAKVRLGAAAPAAANIGNRTGEALYKAVCGACHTAGVANAPKTGDKAAWAPHIASGLDHMLQIAIQGKGAMPPRGGSDGTDEELKRAIAFMANQSGANFPQ